MNPQIIRATIDQAPAIAAVLHSAFLEYEPLYSPQGFAAALGWVSAIFTRQDQQGSMVFSPIVETVQLRHFQPLQRFYAFGLNRTLLFANVSGGMKPMNEEIPLFFSHGDVFLMGAPIEAEIPGKCMGCHIDDGQGIWGIKSILSYSRARFPLEQNAQSTLVQTTPEQEAGTIIAWKMQQANWQRLQVVWHSIEP